MATATTTTAMFQLANNKYMRMQTSFRDFLKSFCFPYMGFSAFYFNYHGKKSEKYMKNVENKTIYEVFKLGEGKLHRMDDGDCADFETNGFEMNFNKYLEEKGFDKTMVRTSVFCTRECEFEPGMLIVLVRMSFTKERLITSYGNIS
jgi:hypothetical protein